MNPYSRESLHHYATTRGQIRTDEDWVRFLQWEGKQRQAKQDAQEQQRNRTVDAPKQSEMWED